MDETDDLIDRCRAKLGEPDGVYRPGPLGRNLLRGVGMLVGGLVLVAVLGVVAPRAIPALGKVLFGLPVVGGILIYHALAARGRAILTYPDGLLPVGRGEVAWLPWEAAGPLHLRAKGGTRDGVVIAVTAPGVLMNLAKLTVGRGDDGPPVEIRPALTGYPDLVARVQRETFARRWPEVLARFEAGETVGFGAFDVHRDALGKGSKTISWDRVKSVDLKGGRVLVKRYTRLFAWAYESLEKVADPHLFLALADHARGVAAAPAEDDSDSPPDPGEV